MMPELQHLSEKDQAFLLAAALKERDRAFDLFEHLGEADVERLRDPLERLLQRPKESHKLQFSGELTRLAFHGRGSLFKYAEAGWIVEHLREESPLVVAIILRELPKIKAGRVLGELPRELRKDLKQQKMQPVSEAVVRWVRKRFEQSFPSIPTDWAERQESLAKLAQLEADPLMRLLREAAIHELSVAFVKINRSATRAILHRLNLQDAKELQHRIKQGGEFSLELQREAQLNILSLDFEKIGPKELMQEIGFSLLSKCFSEDTAFLAPLFIYKLPPKQGYVLKRHVDLNLANSNADKAGKLRERILEGLLRMKPGS